MGTASSRFAEDPVKNLTERSLPSTPIVPSNIQRLEADPRSPSFGIVRTPIEVLKSSVVNTDRDIEMDVGVTDFDPRSPTTEFSRTPVVASTVLEKPLHNKILDNARQPLIAITPIKSKISEKKSRKISQGVLGTGSLELFENNLDSAANSVEYKRNSAVGLLETNLDFIETDLDFVIQRKTPPTLSKAVEDDDKIENDVEFANGNDSSETVEVPVVDLNISKVQVEEFDKKLTHLIYEDKLNVTESPKSIKTVLTHRTPLGDRNSNNQQRRSVPILKVSDKPTKLIGGSSKIPVYKNKIYKDKIDSAESENVPPSKIKPKQSHWGTEDSLVI